jgi:hypothetical protein
MNDKKTRRIAIGLAGFLISYFCYQVVYGTNDSSYKYGYDAGLQTYECLTENTHYLAGNCDNFPSNSDVNIDCVSLANTSGGQDTNSTTCHDGFVAGWHHWCVAHTKDCTTNAIPKPNYIKAAS